MGLALCSEKCRLQTAPSKNISDLRDGLRIFRRRIVINADGQFRADPVTFRGVLGLRECDKYHGFLVTLLLYTNILIGATRSVFAAKN